MGCFYCVSPKGVNYYELEIKRALSESCVKMFPSPTGVNYYEFDSVPKGYMVWHINTVSVPNSG